MKAKPSPSFPLSARAVFRASAPSLQQIPRNFKGSPTGRLSVSQPEIQSLPGTPTAEAQRQLDKAARLGLGFDQGVERFKALAADPQVQEIAKTFEGSNPGKKLLASTSGTITALKSIRETAASWYVVYYGESDKEVRIAKNDPRRRVFDTLEDAEAWATGGAKIMATSLVVYGPKACGKTRNADKLMRRHGLSEVVELDEMSAKGIKPKARGVLYLTCENQTARKFASRCGLRSMHYEAAITTVTK